MSNQKKRTINIYCVKKKVQQWKQFQQIKQRCVLGMEPKLQRNILPLLCRGSHFTVTPHPMETLILKYHFTKTQTTQNKSNQGWVGNEARGIPIRSYLQ